MRYANHRARILPVLGLCVALLGACGSNRAESAAEPHDAVTLLFAGDVMLGRGVAPTAAADSAGLFRDVRHVVRRADVAMANLESPLTLHPHASPNPFALEAHPDLAELVSAAGFDVLSLANNHAGDAGPEGIVDTVSAVEAAGMATVGVGASGAPVPLVLERNGVCLAVLAFATNGGPEIVGWNPEALQTAIEQAAASCDVVVVSLHGGVAYLLEADPRVARMAEQLVSWGADIVWGHGPHVVQPLTTHVREDRIAIVAPSVGNFLFDQRGSNTGRGGLLEVMVDADGVVAHRVGRTRHDDLRVHFAGWSLPQGNAALVAGEWWQLDRALPAARDATTPVEFPYGDVVAADTGRVTGGDPPDVVVSFRHVGRAHPVRAGFPTVDWVDDEGRTAHLGLYAADDLAPRWVAGMTPRPIVDVAACDGAVALAFSSLDEPAVVATGAARWRGFGLVASDELPGPGTPACADVDRDGLLDPVVLGRG